MSEICDTKIRWLTAMRRYNGYLEAVYFEIRDQTKQLLASTQRFDSRDGLLDVRTHFLR